VGQGAGAEAQSQHSARQLAAIHNRPGSARLRRDARFVVRYVCEIVAVVAMIDVSKKIVGTLVLLPDIGISLHFAAEIFTVFGGCVLL